AAVGTGFACAFARTCSAAALRPSGPASRARPTFSVTFSLTSATLTLARAVCARSPRGAVPWTRSAPGRACSRLLLPAGLRSGLHPSHVLLRGVHGLLGHRRRCRLHLRLPAQRQHPGDR